MKNRTFVSILILVLAVLIIAGSCATQQKAVSPEDAVDVFSGTWVNHDNPIVRKMYADGFFHFQKFVLTADRTFEHYHSVDDKVPFGPGKYTVVNCWEDRKGNTYCQVMCQIVTGSRIYALWKLDESRTVLEQNFYYGGEGKYPKEIVKHDVIEDDYRATSGDLFYNIFYRQE